MGPLSLDRRTLNMKIMTNKLLCIPFNSNLKINCLKKFEIGVSLTYPTNFKRKQTNGIFKMFRVMKKQLVIRLLYTVRTMHFMQFYVEILIRVCVICRYNYSTAWCCFCLTGLKVPDYLAIKLLLLTVCTIGDGSPIKYEGKYVDWLSPPLPGLAGEPIAIGDPIVIGSIASLRLNVLPKLK